jgi:homoserine kinase
MGGLVAASALLGGLLTTADLLRLATEIEGHPDNAAPALLGGFVVSAELGDSVNAIRFDVPRGPRAVVFVPDVWLTTEEMRRVLPADVPLADALANLCRVALGVAGLATGRIDVLRHLTEDRLHEPYRALPYPHLPRLVEAARAAGAIGACLSGAGSSVIAFVEPGSGPAPIHAALRDVASDVGLPGYAIALAPRNQGVVVVAVG